MLKSDELIQELETIKAKAGTLEKAEDIRASIKEIKSLKNEIEKTKKEEEGEMERIDEKINNGGGTILHGENEINKNNKLSLLTTKNITNIYKNTDNLDLGNYLRGAITGKWGNATKEMNEFKALSTGTGTVLIPQSLSAQILKAIMNKSLIYKSGVPVIDLVNNNLTIAKVTNTPSFGFKEELAIATPSDATFEGVQLKGKMIYGLMKVSLEIMHSADNLTEVLLQAMSDSIANSIDKSMLYGTGTNNDIKGIFNYDTINTVEATKIDYSSFINAVGKIRQANGEPSIMGVNATIDTSLNLLVDTLGQPIEQPKVIANLNRVISNNLRSNLGTGLDESEGIVYDPNALIIGSQVQFAFEVSREAGFDDGSVWLRVYSLIDMAVTRPEHITYITKLK